jgi:hypothetical protein
MLTTLLLAFFGGRWVDDKWHFTFPLCTLLFLLVVIIGNLIKIVKDTSSKK